MRWLLRAAFRQTEQRRGTGLSRPMHLPEHRQLRGVRAAAPVGHRGALTDALWKLQSATQKSSYVLRRSGCFPVTISSSESLLGLSPLPFTCDASQYSKI